MSGTLIWLPFYNLMMESRNRKGLSSDIIILTILSMWQWYLCCCRILWKGLWPATKNMTYILLYLDCKAALHWYVSSPNLLTLWQGYPATEAEAVQPHPILFLFLFISKTSLDPPQPTPTPRSILEHFWIFNPIQPMGLVLEPKKALKMIFLTPNILYVFGKHFWCTFRFCH